MLTGASGEQISIAPDDEVQELLVLEGTLEDEHGTYPKGAWLRQPDGSSHSPYSRKGCTLWVKRGHLPRVNPE